MKNFVSHKAERADAPHPMAAKVAAAADRLKPMQDCTPQEARAIREERGNPFAPQACELASIETVQVSCRHGYLPARLYKPVRNDDDPLSVLVYFHGGGFVLSSVEQFDTVTQQLAFHSGCAVLSVEYRLAPESKSVAVYQDGFDAYQWVREQGQEYGLDTQRVALGGDSAGGNLSLAVAWECGQQKYLMPDFLLLIYPATDWKMDSASIKEFAEGYFLTQAGMKWFSSHFLEDEERASHPQVSSLLADLSGYPSSYVMTAGFDPLRDEGQALVERLRQFDVPVVHSCYTDMVHGFISFAGGIPAGMLAFEEMGMELKKALQVKI